MDVPDTSAYSTSGMDGGNIGPMTDDTALSAAAKPGVYLPSRVIMVRMVRLEVALVAELISLHRSAFSSGSATVSSPEINQKWSNKCHAFFDRRGPPWVSSQQNSASRQGFLLPERYSYKIKVLQPPPLLAANKAAPLLVPCFFHRNHVWNDVTSSVRASRVIGLCGAMDKRPARERTNPT
jgi:hypothetical protein